MEVLDNGVGFDPARVEASDASLRGGIMSMRERVGLVDGRLEIKTAPGGGTTVIATVPLGPAASSSR